MNRLVVVALYVIAAGCASAPSLSPPAATSAAAAQPADPLIRQLRNGGYVLYIRHGKTEQAFQDQPSKPRWWKSCDTRSSRPLSDEGRQQMLTLGAQMREFAIPVARVVTSEYCRAIDTGLLLQLMPITQDMRLNLIEAHRADGRDDQTARKGLLEMLSTAPPAAKNIVLVAHVTTFVQPIDPVLQQLAEGEMAVIRAGPDGRIEVVGRLPLERWLARAPN
jgi:phosphohistidine phosphatase SixA